MLARPFLVVVMALTTLPHSSRPQVPEPPGRVLLTAAPLSDEISSLMVVARSGSANSPAYVLLRIQGQYAKGNPNRLSHQTVQAWLLRADGTAVPAIPKLDAPDRPMTGDIGPDIIFFAFVTVPANELAGVVVSVNGRLLVREIKASS
jgi:hypothetical protein